jgi:hypothetical protein
MIEYLAPAVYLTEIPFSATPIEGVSTSTADLAGPTAGARQSPAHTPEWTDLNQGDPGVTLLELFSWPDLSILYRTGFGAGSVGGLSIDGDNGSRKLSVAPGQALDPHGRPVDARTETARRLIDPD